MNKHLFVSLAFIVGFHHLLFAQTHRLEGHIRSQGEPISFASVYLPELRLATHSDEEGKFQFPKVKQGNYELVISHVSYEKLTQNIDIQEDISGLEIELASNMAIMEEVVITGTMKEVSKMDSPVPVEVYRPAFFMKNPVPSLFEGIQQVNGVRPQLQCNVCNTGDIHINGMEGPYTMVLIDGMPIVSALSTVYGLHGIPQSMIERVEVIKGPAATLYGSEAMGGIINVITKDPQRSPSLVFDVNATSYEELNIEGAATVKIGKTHGLFSANYFHYDNPMDINGDNFTDVTLQKRISLFNKWSFQRSNDRVADIAVRYVNEDRWGGELQWTPQYRGTDEVYGESILTERWEVLGNYEIGLGRESMMFNYSFNSHLQDSYYGDVKYLADQKVAFGQLTWQKDLGQHEILAGTAFRYTFYDDNTAVTFDEIRNENAASHTALPGVFVQDEISLSQKMTLLAGIRYDHHSEHGSIVSPRLNLKWSPNTFHTFRLSAGNGFRVVNVFSEDHAALTGGRRVIFAEELMPERSWNTNLNYVRFINTPFGFINLDASIFYTYFDNKIIPDYDRDPEVIYYANLSEYGENKGFSLNTDWTFMNGVKVNAGFTWMDVYTVEDGEKVPQINTPDFTANWAVSYTIPKLNINIDYTGYANSPMRLPVFENDYRPEESPWFSIHNLKFSKQFDNGFEVYAGVKNLFNFYPTEDVILRPFDPFDKFVDDPVNNPNGYTFDPTYNYAPIQRARGFVGVKWVLQRGDAY